MWQKISNWIYEMPKGSEVFLLPLAVIGWDITFNNLALGILSSFTTFADQALEVGVPILSWDFPFELIFAAALEEVVFRILPLALVMHFVKKRWVTFSVAVIASIIFGLIHGGPMNILIQGVGGLIYSGLFIKYSDNGTKFARAGIIVILMHIIFNTMITLEGVSFGVMEF